ncbi:unnamed protein product, partial [marine sediment metagenome]
IVPTRLNPEYFAKQLNYYVIEIKPLYYEPSLKKT